ncbi:MAG: hypothetical protein H7293_20080 [Candidatus Saccharibacteria bacterium]|nr:hypothetical protein [Rhodoferax sp.]
MQLSDLVEEFHATRSPGWLVLTPEAAIASGVDAVRYYAAYGDIASLSTGINAPLVAPALAPNPLPGKLLDIDESTNLTAGEWAIIRPLFVLYVERECAMLLEASRAAGLEVYGRSVSEIAQDITMMENETLPGKCFSYAVIEV